MNAESSQKLCMIQNTGLINKLTADPTVTCAKCGAQAHDPASLCSPMPLSKSGSDR